VPALGRKNYYGSNAEWSGTLAMTLFSVFATLQEVDINPRTWLRGSWTAAPTPVAKSSDIHHSAMEHERNATQKRWLNQSARRNGTTPWTAS